MGWGRQRRKGPGTGTREMVFKSQFCHLSLCLEANYLTFLSLSLLRLCNGENNSTNLLGRL